MAVDVVVGTTWKFDSLSDVTCLDMFAPVTPHGMYSVSTSCPSPLSPLLSEKDMVLNRICGEQNSSGNLLIHVCLEGRPINRRVVCFLWFRFVFLMVWHDVLVFLTHHSIHVT